MAEPTNELMLNTLVELRREVAEFRSDVLHRLDRLEGRTDRLAERFDILTVRLDDGFADLRVAVRAAGSLAVASERSSDDLKARIVALELRVAELERQD